MTPISHGFGGSKLSAGEQRDTSPLPQESWQHGQAPRCQMRQEKNKKQKFGEEELPPLPDCVRETTGPSLGMGSSCHRAARYNPPSTVKGIKKGIV